MSIKDYSEKINPKRYFESTFSVFRTNMRKIYTRGKLWLFALENRLGGEGIDRLYICIIVILVGLSAYGLGRLSALEEAREPITIETEEASVSQTPISTQRVPMSKSVENSTSDGTVVASRNGTKYYLPWCAGASRISAQNKITFPSTALAKAKGYTPASNCPGIN